MKIPNVLTMARVILTPLLALLLLRNYVTAGFVVFLVAGLTDAFDGLLARVLDQKSRFGSFMDPLADKLLLVTSFLVLWKIGEIPLWLVLITVGRDLLILCGFCALVFCRVKFEIRPLVSSKLTTFFQLLTIFAVLGRSILVLSAWVYSALFVTTAVFSILSGWQYVSRGVSLYKLQRREIQ